MVVSLVGDSVQEIKLVLPMSILHHYPCCYFPREFGAKETLRMIDVMEDIMVVLEDI